MRPLVESMVNSDVTARPTMSEVVETYKTIVSKLSSWQLRSRLVRREDDEVVNALKDVYFLYCRFIPRLILRVPPIPTPKSSSLRSK